MTKTKKRKSNNPALAEIREMLPFFLIADIVLVLVALVLQFFMEFTFWKALVGAVLGSMLALLNFYFIGLTAESIVKRKNEKSGRFYANASYGARYVGIFAVLALLLYLDIANIVTLLIPLFYPRLYYTLKYIRKQDDPFAEHD